jgi:hypothetical protein
MSKLADVAEIYSGFAVQGAVTPDPSGNMLIVRPADGNARHEIDWSNVVRMNLAEGKKHRILEVGDVLFRSVGTSNPTYLVADTPADMPSIAHQHFLHIRFRGEGWDPGFLVLLLNSKKIQGYMRGQASGATRGIVKRGVLEDFELPSVPIGDQKDWVARWHEQRGKIEQLEAEIERVEEGFSLAFESEAVYR